jgi:hypothetical protein
MPSKSDQKLSLKAVKKMPYSALSRMINKAKRHIRDNEIWIRMCDEYDQDPDIIDLIPMMFGDLDVSAKTDHGIIILNYQLLCDGDFFKDFSYLLHESRHFFDQCFGEKATKSSDDGDYLHNKYEQKAFTDQVEFIADQFGEPEAEKYVDELLEHHDKDGKEAEKLKDTLMSQI